MACLNFAFFYSKSVVRACLDLTPKTCHAFSMPSSLNFLLISSSSFSKRMASAVLFSADVSLMCSGVMACRQPYCPGFSMLSSGMAL